MSRKSVELRHMWRFDTTLSPGSAVVASPYSRSPFRGSESYLFLCSKAARCVLVATYSSWTVSLEADASLGSFLNAFRTHQPILFMEYKKCGNENT